MSALERHPSRSTRDSRPVLGGLSRRSVAILCAAIVTGILHHADHVLRVDHSGWPFRPDVNPFTFSLLAYPILLFTLLGPRRLFWLRFAVFSLGVGFTLYAHSMIETPAMQYAMWAHNHSIDPHDAGSRNLLDTRSSILGTIAVVIGMSLNVLLVGGWISMIVDGSRFRRERARPHPPVTPLESRR